MDATKSLSRSALALHANTVITAGLGYLFLAIASRLYDPEQLGRDMALVSAMMLLAALSELNLGMALPRFAPSLGRRTPRVIALSYLVTTTIALVASGLFVLIAPRVSDSLSFLGASVGIAALFVAAVAFWNVFAIQDAALTALRRASWIPIESGIFAVAKIVLMIAWAGSTLEHGVFLSWVVPMAIMVLPITWLLFARVIPDHLHKTSGQQVAVLSNVKRYLGFDYASSLLVQLGVTTLPMLVLISLGAIANASFAIAFSISSAIQGLVMNLGTSLLVAGSYDTDELARLVRHTFKRYGPLFLGLVVVVAIFAPLAMLPFDDAYSDTVPDLLRLLVVGLLPQSIVLIYQAVERIKGNAGRVMASTAAQMVCNLAGVFVGAQLAGLNGVGWGWLASNAVVAAIVAPRLIAAARGNAVKV